VVFTQVELSLFEGGGGGGGRREEERGERYAMYYDTLSS